jgi:BNR repeat-containing family member
MRGFIAILIALSTATCAVGQDRVRVVPVAPGWAGNSVNVVIFRRNSITSRDGTQYLAFYDQDGHVVLAKRALYDLKWEIHKTQYSGDVRDAHNAICIAVDGKGFLHVAWDHHSVQLRYAHSVAAGSLELSDKLPMTGKHETRVTYPEFYNLPDGGLLFIYRDGSSGNGNLVMNRYDVQTGQWQQVHENLIDGQNQRNAYWQVAVDQGGTIHLSWVWRETGDVATNHDLCYAKSTNGGKTWLKSSGDPYTLPINADNAEVAVKIGQKHELINQTSMTTDSKHRPYIATYWREEGQDIPQYHVVYFDGAAWRVSQIGQLTIPFRLGGTGTKRIPISRPQIFTDTTGAADKAYLLFRDEGRGNKVSVASCDDLTKAIWKIEDLTQESVGQWEPSYDAALWENQRSLNVFVQRAEQRDGEGVSNVPPEMVQVLEWKP